MHPCKPRNHLTILAQGQGIAPSSPPSPLNPNAAEFTPAAARSGSDEAPAAMEGMRVALKPAADHAPVEEVKTFTVDRLGCSSASLNVCTTCRSRS